MTKFDDGSECAICMEPLDARDVVALPCACAVSYCFRCWDRAPSSSFNARGQASCPTCEFPDVGDRGDLETVARTLLHADVARGTSSVICDLCDRPVPPRGAVYTCASGETTVLHATEYDVCERCFVDFAVDGRSDGALPQTRRVGAR